MLTGSNADILSAPSRLAAIPANGQLIIEATCTDSEATNRALITLQLPNGDVPFEDLIVPINGFFSADNVMHNDTELIISMNVGQGGHVLFSYTEVGTVALAFFIITLSF